MPAVEFKYAPLQWVVISLFGLEYAGRVQRCLWDGQHALYDVQYAVNGELRNGAFYEDELK